MKKKILAINSSRLNGNTKGKLLETIEALGTEKYEFEIIDLMKKEIKECVGCEACLKGGDCGLKDDANSIMSKMREADAIVLGSPVYMFNVCGRLKTFADRTCKWFHRPELAGKPILSVITTSGAGIKDAERYMKKLSYQWGGYPSGAVKRNIRNLRDEIEAKEIETFKQNIEKGSKSFKPSMNMIMMFNTQKVLAQRVLKHDEEYWREKEWIDKPYFYECKINPLKKATGKMFHKMLYKRIKREYTD